MKKLVLFTSIVLSFAATTFAADLRDCEYDRRNCTTNCGYGSGGQSTPAYNACVSVCNSNYNSCADRAYDRENRERICRDQRNYCSSNCWSNANGSNQAAVNLCLSICESNYRACL